MTAGLPRWGKEIAQITVAPDGDDAIGRRRMTARAEGRDEASQVAVGKGKARRAGLIAAVARMGEGPKVVARGPYGGVDTVSDESHVDRSCMGEA